MSLNRKHSTWLHSFQIASLSILFIGQRKNFGPDLSPALALCGWACLGQNGQILHIAQFFISYRRYADKKLLSSESGGIK